MHWIWYVVEAFVIAPLFYALGWAACRKALHRKLTREAIVRDVRSWRTWLEQVNQWVTHWLALIAAVVLVATAFVYITGTRQHTEDQAGLRAQSACFRTFANKLHDSLVPRQHASKRLQHADTLFNDALLRVLTDALSPHPNPVKGRRDALALRDASAAKKALAERLNRDRAANPYPPPPEKVCPT